MQRSPVVDGAGGRIPDTALSDLQAGHGIGRQRPQGRARHLEYDFIVGEEIDIPQQQRSAASMWGADGKIGEREDGSTGI